MSQVERPEKEPLVDYDQFDKEKARDAWRIYAEVGFKRLIEADIKEV